MQDTSPILSPVITPRPLPYTVAHRGLSAHAPENTLAAVKAAHRVGCQWVELDVQLLGDGTPVIWHDNGVRRCSDSRGKLAKLNLAKAKALDVGTWFSADFQGERMATLAEMLELLNELDMGLNLELKVNRGRDAQALVDAALPMTLGALPAERLIVSSFNSQALKAARGLEPDAQRLRLGILYEKPTRQWHEEAERLEAYSLHVDWRRLKEKRAREIKDAGYRLLCYTANDPVAFARLWPWGVDSVISDDPSLFEHHLPDSSQQRI
ncbi:glycerophosphoryl diester phosphodiesterase [Litchfieldella qijiaojingensis]|uniref:Glycerophosphoryl diester phosphodiesterase n=1 Tax=Litchfieldella qijiaojingensis TaxID=980347 RepID=A0ABQ2YID6_9GAMM|nr:glycerophosphoryl diester phosphodiesterase [Halomonas qijiaojingensis]GGX82455.1 glycerophosphoryl diester phosphodiesterase [Halomonas qijiaojingensis]